MPTGWDDETFEHLCALFRRANERLIAQERELFQRDISERCLCARLAVHMNNELASSPFAGLFIDVEYNRNHLDKKRIRLGGGLKRITCDLIVHSRGRLPASQDNMLALEMKKSTRPEAEKKADKDRLRALTCPYPNNILDSHHGEPPYVCGYRVGIYYEYNIRNGQILLEFYRDGKPFGEKLYLSCR